MMKLKQLFGSNKRKTAKTSRIPKFITVEKLLERWNIDDQQLVHICKEHDFAKNFLDILTQQIIRFSSMLIASKSRSGPDE